MSDLEQTVRAAGQRLIEDHAATRTEPVSDVTQKPSHPRDSGTPNAEGRPPWANDR